MTNHPIVALKHMAYTYGVEDIASEVTNNERFKIWSGSSKPYQHHYGDEGLCRHTFEVANLCLANYKLCYQMDVINLPETMSEVYLAALFHDIGKIEDYVKLEGVWTSHKHKRLIHHISRSAIIWSRAVDKYPAYRNIEENVLHAILAHHGLREWGSPVAPKSKLAWLLHLCDGLSARMSDADTLDVVKRS